MDVCLCTMRESIRNVNAKINTGNWRARDWILINGLSVQTNESMTVGSQKITEDRVCLKSAKGWKRIKIVDTITSTIFNRIRTVGCESISKSQEARPNSAPWKDIEKSGSERLCGLMFNSRHFSQRPKFLPCGPSESRLEISALAEHTVHLWSQNCSLCTHWWSGSNHAKDDFLTRL